MGRPEVSQYGEWMAALLAVEARLAAISHQDALALWGIQAKSVGNQIHVSMPRSCRSRHPGIVAHCRRSFGANDVTRRRGIRVTKRAVTIVDIAASRPRPQLERVINEADQLGVIPFPVLLRELERMSRRPGLGTVKSLVLPHTFRLTRSELERLFLPIARSAGLETPQTLAIVNGFEVDFWFPELALVVETDSLTYHRTPAKQAQDRIRDQTHIARGLWPLRFTHWQIARQPRYVESVLRRVAERAGRRGA